MSDAWQMQEPVFRTSDGEIVRPRARVGGVAGDATREVAVPFPRPAADASDGDGTLSSLYAPPETDGNGAAMDLEVPAAEPSPAAAPASAAPAAAPAPVELANDITDQPYVSEEYDVEEINAAVTAAEPPRSGKGSIIFKIIAAIIVLAAFGIAAIFLAWFLFMRTTD
jgi:hypothetical protein